MRSEGRPDNVERWGFPMQHLEIHFMDFRCPGIVLLLLAAIPLAFADAPAKEPEAVALVDASGKELKLTGIKLTTGTRRLAFLADPKGTTDEARKGPLAFEIREPHSTTFQKGVATLVPVSTIEAVKYDYPKLTMSVAIKGHPEVAGTLQFRGINLLGVEGKVGDLPGKFTGGAPKGGFHSIAFPGARPLSPRGSAGQKWAVQIVQPAAQDPVLIVRNLKALYAFPGGAEQLLDAIPVRKGEPLQLNARIKKLEFIAVDLNTRMAALEVLLEGGTERLIAVPLTLEQGKRTGTLTGLVGEVDCGWKLFPLHAIKLLKPSE